MVSALRELVIEQQKTRVDGLASTSPSAGKFSLRVTHARVSGLVSPGALFAQAPSELQNLLSFRRHFHSWALQWGRGIFPEKRG